MTRTVRCVSCAALLWFHAHPVSAQQIRAQESKPVTLTATIEAVDAANRVITLARPDGTSVDIKAEKEMEGFKTLKAGDRVTATYYEAVLLTPRKPGDPPPPAEPTTTIQRKDRKPGSDRRVQQTFRMTVDTIDVKAPSITVKGAQGRVVTLALQDGKALQALKVGDTVDVTYFESLLINVSRPPK
jgi:hypothetical protein